MLLELVELLQNADKIAVNERVSNLFGKGQIKGCALPILPTLNSVKLHVNTDVHLMPTVLHL